MLFISEPVDQQAIAHFYETFRPFGLKSGVVVPTYGLAEHTVFVCSGGETVLTLQKSAFENQIISIVSASLLGEVGGLSSDNAGLKSVGQEEGEGGVNYSMKSVPDNKEAEDENVQVIIVVDF